MFPPRILLAATDFSDASRTALSLAARLALHVGATLHVVHAEDPLLAAAAAQSDLDLRRDTREELERLVADTVPADRCQARLHVEIGPAVEVTLDVARRERADMVVVGSRGMSGAARLVFGSTTERLLRDADLPVLVAPPGWTPAHADAGDLTGTGPIVAAIDFSDASVAAATAGCALASALGTSVEAVHVVPGLAVPARWRTQAESAVRERVVAAQASLAAVVRGLPCASTTTARVETGDVPGCLSDLTRPDGTRDPWLLIGRRAPGAPGVAPGAIAYRTLTLAEVPVLMHIG